MLGIYSQLSDYTSQVQLLLHDQSASDYSVASLVPIINNARLRTATDCRCVGQFIQGLNTITQQESYPLSGFVGGMNVLNGGANYTNPTITITGGGGTGAACQAIPLSGALTTNNTNMVSWGGGYTSVPTVTVTDPTGSGAVLQPVTGLGILDIATMTVLWNGPPSALAVTFSWLPFGAFQAFCRAYRGVFSNPGAWTAHYGTTSPTSPQADARQFFMYPIPNQPYPLEMAVATLPVNLVNQTDVDYQIQSPWNDAVQYFAAHLALLGLHQWAAATVMKTLYDNRLKELPATTFSRRVHNFYRSFRALAGRI